MDNLISKEDFGRLEQLATINMSGVSHFALAKVFVFDLFPKNVLCIEGEWNSNQRYMMHF